ncbi:MAG TPA: hypothetical protein DE036_07695 [Actinobacteria bacterium]|nr:hypothetical protein [Actinomycetota bacterium]
MSLFKNLFGKSQPPEQELGRNEKCWCGSDKKYKHCHFEKDQKRLAAIRASQCTSRG